MGDEALQELPANPGANFLFLRRGEVSEKGHSRLHAHKMSMKGWLWQPPHFLPPPIYQNDMHRYLLSIPDNQFDQLRDISDKTEEPMSVWVRRFLEYGMRDSSLNDLVPSMSGQLSGKRREQ